MHKQSLRVVVVLAVAIATALAGADQAGAAVLIDACQTLSDPNITYKLTTDLTSCGDCLVVAANKVTIDLQGHSITFGGLGCGGCGDSLDGICFNSVPGGPFGAAITDHATPLDVITVKNGGTLGGFAIGVFLESSTRVSVLGVTVTGNTNRGIMVGPQGVVKFTEASHNNVGIEVGPRGIVKESNAHHNGFAGIKTLGGDNCLITLNTANFNNEFGIITDGDECTISYNTASDNGERGIDAGHSFGGTDNLVTHNVAEDNGVADYGVNCPSDVTFNKSTDGFPSSSYQFKGSGCHTANNN